MCLSFCFQFWDVITLFCMLLWKILGLTSHLELARPLRTSFSVTERRISSYSRSVATCRTRLRSLIGAAERCGIRVRARAAFEPAAG